MKPLLWLALVLGLAIPSQANDSAVSGMGGSWRMMRSEHRTLAMLSEEVNIRVRPDATYQVVARFVFHNFGRSQSVQMGFPESGGGDVGPGNTTTFSKFQTLVDGRRARVRRVLTQRGSEESNFSALWLKTVPFGAGQTRRVQVSYISEGGGMSSGEHWVNYDFTGGNWRGLVRKSVLTVQLPPGWYAVRPFDDLPNEPLAQTTRQGGRFRFCWTNWQAQISFDMEFRRLVRGGFYMDNSPVAFQRAMLVNSPDPVPSGCNAQGVDVLPDAIQHDGHLWLSLSFLTRERGRTIPAVFKKTWNAEKNTLFLWSRRRYLPVKMTKFPLYDSQALRHPNSPFQLMFNGHPELFLPARTIERALGQKFHPSPSSLDPCALGFG